MESDLVLILLIVAVPLLAVVGVTLAVSRLRRWTAAQEEVLSSAESMDSIALCGGAFLMFVGVTLIVSTGVMLQGFVVAFLGAPFVIFMGYFYPRALRAHINRLKTRISELERTSA